MHVLVRIDELFFLGCKLACCLAPFLICSALCAVIVKHALLSYVNHMLLLSVCGHAGIPVFQPWQQSWQGITVLPRRQPTSRMAPDAACRVQADRHETTHSPKHARQGKQPEYAVRRNDKRGHILRQARAGLIRVGVGLRTGKEGHAAPSTAMHGLYRTRIQGAEQGMPVSGQRYNERACI